MNANGLATLELLASDGQQTIPADSLNSGVWRPNAQGELGGRIATLETLYDYWINNVPDPDEAYALDPRIREQIKFHQDVQACMRKRSQTVASFPYRFEPNAESRNPEGAGVVAKYVEWAFSQIPDIQRMFEWMQGAVIDGGTGVEFVWNREVDGVVRPVKWWPVHKSRFCFDRLGNMALKTRSSPVYGSYIQPAMANRLNTDDRWIPAKYFPEGRVLYHVHRVSAGSWELPGLEGYVYWGLGEDVSLFYPVTFDIYVLQKRMQWLETWANPPTYVWFTDSGKYVNSLNAVCTSLRGQSVASLPKSSGPDGKGAYFEIDRQVAPTGSYDPAGDFNDRFAKPAISAILLGSGDENSTGQEKSGYSGTVARKEGGPDVWYRWDSRNIESSINTQLVPAIARARFGNLAKDLLPKFTLEPKEEKDRNQEATILESATKMIEVPKSYIYSQLGIPQPAKGEETVGGEQQAEMGPDGMPIAAEKTGEKKDSGFPKGKIGSGKKITPIGEGKDKEGPKE